ncbi:hypothetical protein [Sulfuricaulis sp.]|jgi:V/A-type H+-transporting ATPase subunit B
MPPARVLDTRRLAAIVGAENLAQTDRRFLKFAQEFEMRFAG